MQINKSLFLFFITGLFSATQHAFADSYIETKRGQAIVKTWNHGLMTRTENSDGISITRWDKEVTWTLHPNTKTYEVMPLPIVPYDAKHSRAQNQISPIAEIMKGQCKRETVKTSEKKMIAGFSATAYINSCKETPGDGFKIWVADPAPIPNQIQKEQIENQEKVRNVMFKNYPLTERQKAINNIGLEDFPAMVFGKNMDGFELGRELTSGQIGSQYPVEVTTLNTDPVDPALFEIPPGFKEKSESGFKNQAEIKKFLEKLKSEPPKQTPK